MTKIDNGIRDPTQTGLKTYVSFTLMQNRRRQKMDSTFSIVTFMVSFNLVDIIYYFCLVRRSLVCDAQNPNCQQTPQLRNEQLYHNSANNLLSFTTPQLHFYDCY